MSQKQNPSPGSNDNHAPFDGCFYPENHDDGQFGDTDEAFGMGRNDLILNGAFAKSVTGAETRPKCPPEAEPSDPVQLGLPGMLPSP